MPRLSLDSPPCTLPRYIQLLDDLVLQCQVGRRQQPNATHGSRTPQLISNRQALYYVAVAIIVMTLVFPQYTSLSGDYLNSPPPASTQPLLGILQANDFETYEQAMERKKLKSANVSVSPDSLALPS